MNTNKSDIKGKAQMPKVLRSVKGDLKMDKECIYSAMVLYSVDIHRLQSSIFLRRHF